MRTYISCISFSPTLCGICSGDKNKHLAGCITNWQCYTESLSRLFVICYGYGILLFLVPRQDLRLLASGLFCNCNELLCVQSLWWLYQPSSKTQRRTHTPYTMLYPVINTFLLQCSRQHQDNGRHLNT